MKWTVVWHTEAMNSLMEIWLLAADRNAVSLAANLIDRTLLHDAGTLGEEFYGDRLYDVAPLSVVFRVSEPDRVATVLQVWYQPEPAG